MLAMGPALMFVDENVHKEGQQKVKPAGKKRAQAFAEDKRRKAHAVRLTKTQDEQFVTGHIKEIQGFGSVSEYVSHIAELYIKGEDWGINAAGKTGTCNCSRNTKDAEIETLKVELKQKSASKECLRSRVKELESSLAKLNEEVKAQLAVSGHGLVLCESDIQQFKEGNLEYACREGVLSIAALSTTAFMSVVVVRQAQASAEGTTWSRRQQSVLLLKSVVN